VEFADYRVYVPGDDFRLIDWKAYARLDRFLLRLFHAEEELPLSLFVDLSASMDWGQPNKAWTSRRLAGALAYVALKALDRVRVTIFADSPLATGPPARGRRGAAELFHRLQRFPAGGRTEYKRLTAPITRQRPGMSLLITDGLGEAEVEPALLALQRARQEGAVLQVLAPQELDPQWAGDARLRDAETGAERDFTRTPGATDAYLSALDKRSRELESAAHRHGLRFARISSDEPVEVMVGRTLRRIGLLHR
jgi:uncharacterized protein (DUF58 family)